jgi:hypothetical protein
MSNALFGLSPDEASHMDETYRHAIALFMDGNVIDAGVKLQALVDSLADIPESDSSVAALRENLKQTVAALRPDFMMSKTSYMKGCQCRKLLYLYKHSPSLRDPISQETKARFDGGHSFEDLFRDEYYPTGKSVETVLQGYVQFYPYLTQLFLHQGVSTMFEPAFVHKQTIVLVDVLNKLEDGNWELIEIKNSKFLKEVFIHDAALQYHVVSNHLPNLTKVQIVLNQNGQPQYHDVTEEVLCRQHAIATRIDHFREILAQDFVPEIETGYQCYKPYKCDFFGFCHGVASRY